jgi:putative ABC transport system permease protein
MHHLTLAWRQLLTQPALSALIVLMLAVGIGATTAIYSLVHQILIEPLPVYQPQRLVNLTSPGFKFGSTWASDSVSDGESLFTHEMFEDLQAEQNVFSGLAAHADFGANLGFEESAGTGRGTLVSGSYFTVLGLPPALGRLIQPQDTAQVDQSLVVVLGFDYWQRELGGRADVIGEQLIVNGQTLEIVGVAPEGFAGTAIGWRTDVFVPYTLRWLMQPSVPRQGPRRSYWVYLFARLAPGVSLQQAELGINAVSRGLLRDVVVPAIPEMNADQRERTLAREILLEPGARGRSNVPGAVSKPLSLLLGLTALVLLIVCVNVASLLLARGAARAGELAIRASIGASRGRLLAQLLTESGGLALLGGILSIPVAALSMALIERFIPTEQAAGLAFRLEPVSFSFTGAALVATVLCFGLGPAWVASRSDPGTVINAHSARSSGGRGLARFRAGLSAAQIAFSTVLLVLAGLFAQSLANVDRVDLGFQPRSLLSFRVAPLLNGYARNEVGPVVERLEDELHAEPGVAEVGTSAVPLLADGLMGYAVSMDGFEPGPGVNTFSTRNVVSPGFFAATGIPLLAGRGFADADRRDAPPVAIVNERFVEKFGLGNALGKRFSLPYEAQNIEIVGVVGDAKYNRVKLDDAPQFFQPRAQFPEVNEYTFYARTSLAPERLLPRVRAIVASVDPGLPVKDLRTMRAQIDENVYLDRLTSTLATAFAALASLLAAIGLYGLMAYSVTQRTRELGLRLALGAAPRCLYAMVMISVGRIALVGTALGLAIAGVASRAAETLLFELSGFEPRVYIAAAAILLLVTLGAGLLPARRAARVEPMEALRQL